MNKCSTIIESDRITLRISQSVTSNILDKLIIEAKKYYKPYKEAFKTIHIDMALVDHIDIEGALAILCYTAAIKEKNTNVNFRLIYPNDKLITFLTSIGFFTQLGLRCGIHDRIDLVTYEHNLIKSKKSLATKSKEYKKSFILPIQQIPKKDKFLNPMQFEAKVGDFANNVLRTIDEIQYHDEYNLKGDDFYYFREANIELFKNIFHHSRSWGLGCIHAKPNVGTTVSFYDIGVGFKSSVEKFANEEESIKWALIDGHSSKPPDENDGFGYTLIQDFVFSRKGEIKIRSGDCLYTVNSTNTKVEKVEKFIGAQITYTIPN